MLPSLTWMDHLSGRKECVFKLQYSKQYMYMCLIHVRSQLPSNVFRLHSHFRRTLNSMKKIKKPRLVSVKSAENMPYFKPKCPKLNLYPAS